MNKTIIAVFDDRTQARQAVEGLLENGYSRDEVSLMANDVRGDETIDQGNIDEESHATRDGAIAGSILGGLGGLLIGMGSLALPGIGTAVVAGPVAGLLVGAATGAVVGGMVGALVELGVPEEDAHIYTEAVRRGSTVVAATVPEEKVPDVSAIFRHYDPIDVKQRSETWREEGWTRFDDSRDPLTVEAIENERSRYAGVRQKA